MQKVSNFDARFRFVSEIFWLLQKAENSLLSPAGLRGFQLIMDDLLAMPPALRKASPDPAPDLWACPPASGRLN